MKSSPTVREALRLLREARAGICSLFDQSPKGDVWWIGLLREIDAFLARADQAEEARDSAVSASGAHDRFPWAQGVWDIMEEVNGLDSHDLTMRVLELIRQRDSYKASFEIARSACVASTAKREGEDA